MNVLELIVSICALLSLSLFVWIAYALWKERYGITNLRINKRLRGFTIEGMRREPEAVKTRVFSKNKRLNAILVRSQFIKELEAQLVKGKVNIQVDSFLLLVTISWLFTFLFFLLLNFSFFLALISASLIGCLPFLTIRHLVNRRQIQLEEQLPNILEFISRAMQAGHTFVGSLQMAAAESPEPISSEFQEAFREINFGKSVQDAMSDLAHRIDCPEMRYFAVAVFINHEIGGNLASLLSGVAALIRERLKLKMSVHAMTSEARVSAWILGLLPFAVALILFAVRPDFISVLWSEPRGRSMIAYTLLLMVIGVFWMQRLSKIRF
ncbi:TadB Flp pilus assembly protein TadB [Burkholderiaceae bacterium]